MKVHPLSLPEIILIEPQVYSDQRGYFFEAHQVRRYVAGGLNVTFVQDNVSFSRRSVVRGMHYQLQHPQGKLITVLQGEILDVVVDLRLDSPNFGKWLDKILSAENHRQLYVPPGFAHGFGVISDTATVLYKVTDYYQPDDEYGIVWDDPDLGIKWPFEEALLSAKDRQLPRLRDLSPTCLPRLAPSPGCPAAELPPV